MEKILMPKMGMTMEYGTIAELFVKVGDAVNEGDPLFEFETNKMSDTVNAPCGGTIQEICCEVDEDVPVGEVVCVIG